jgi:hypothetical protein
MIALEHSSLDHPFIYHEKRIEPIRELYSILALETHLAGHVIQ